MPTGVVSAAARNSFLSDLDLKKSPVKSDGFSILAGTEEDFALYVGNVVQF